MLRSRDGLVIGDLIQETLCDTFPNGMMRSTFVPMPPQHSVLPENVAGEGAGKRVSGSQLQTLCKYVPPIVESHTAIPSQCQAGPYLMADPLSTVVLQ